MRDRLRKKSFDRRFRLPIVACDDFFRSLVGMRPPAVNVSKSE
jgi:hypothetical protein